jgi:2-polyprenyl-3-methyl-5-hydroxy-6-metoxy-1,4-benzoquinol methylase
MSFGSPRPCPVCQRLTETIEVHRQRFSPGPLGNGYTVVVCSECGLGFADGVPSQEELDSYYAEQSKYTYDGAETESPFDRRRFRMLAEQLANVVPDRRARVLDVGCATGGLLAELRALGYQSLEGWDPSPACAQIARERHKVRVSVGTIAELSQRSDTFDAILLVGVFEHVRDLVPCASVLARRLVPGGVLFAAQPDVAGFVHSTIGPFQQFSAEHVNFFSEITLAAAMRQAGLQHSWTWRGMVEWRQGAFDSVLSGAFRRTRVGPTSAAGCAETLPALRNYVRICEDEDRFLSRRIDLIANTGRSVILWGAGALTRRLEAAGQLQKLKIVGVVDQNPHLAGRIVAGQAVTGPSALAVRSEPIVVCSRAFGAEIREAIVNRWQLKNEVIGLF